LLLTRYPVDSFNSSMSQILFLFSITLAVALTSLSLEAAKDKPNFIIIFTDDQGYGDLGCFGSTKIKTPNIDRMAKEGRRFTNFMVASPVCTPSRVRFTDRLLIPSASACTNMFSFHLLLRGLNPTEHTIADHLKDQGLRHCCFWKVAPRTSS